MKLRMAFLFVMAFLIDNLSRAADYRPQVGRLHPDFTLPRIDNGKPLSLSDFRGKKVLLIQFASW